MTTAVLVRHQMRTPNGRPVIFGTRNGTNDQNICVALTEDDEYRMRGRIVSGWAIDIGAHVGGWAIPVAIDNPDLRVVAIEAVPDNAEILRDNVAANGLSDRVTVIAMAAAAPGQSSAECHWGYRHFAPDADGYVAAHRFVGNTWVDKGEAEFGGEVPAISLDAVLAEHGIDEVAMLKIDCEGCEWAFLDSPAVSRIAYITGEYHGGYTDHPAHVPEPTRRIAELLPDHDVKIIGPDPSIGLFEALRRG